MAAREILSEGRIREKIKEAATNALGWASHLLTIHDPHKPDLACKEGCSYCCHVAVSVTIPEVLHIADYLRQTRTAREIEVVKHVVGTTSRQCHLIHTTCVIHAHCFKGSVAKMEVMPSAPFTINDHFHAEDSIVLM
jgi:hypothetical protein